MKRRKAAKAGKKNFAKEKNVAEPKEKGLESPVLESGSSWTRSIVTFMLQCLFVALAIWLVNDGKTFIERFSHLRLGWGNRPVVDIHEKRKLLVVGTMSSGTTELSKRLQLINIEAGHEESDARRMPCRDATISWIHGIRYIPVGSLKSKGIEERATKVCEVQRPMIFDPKQFYVPFGECYTPSFAWTACWKRVCEQTFVDNLGCAVDNNRHCPTPFEHSVILARYPVNIVSSLVSRWCLNPLSNSEPLPIRNYSLSLLDQFPNRNGRNHLHDFLKEVFLPEDYPHMWKDGLTCREQIAWYVVEYYNAMMAGIPKAKDNIVRVEERHNVCHVAKLGGFSGHGHCSELSESDLKGEKYLRNPKPHGKVNVGKKRTKVSLEDFASNPQLLKSLQELNTVLGYQ